LERCIDDNEIDGDHPNKSASSVRYVKLYLLISYLAIADARRARPIISSSSVREDFLEGRRGSWNPTVSSLRLEVNVELRGSTIGLDFVIIVLPNRVNGQSV
jgi:hypothetical protein